jgi:hypothetical protein
MIHSANVGLRFLLELCALATLGYWGYRTGTSVPGKLALAVGAVIAAAAMWGLFVAPNATIPVPGPVHVLLQVAVFGAAVAALISLRHPIAASAFGVTVLANAALMAAWGQ